MNKTVSVVVLNWNGKKSLKKCLQSLKLVIYKPLEVLVVDNDSHDGSPEMVESEFKWVTLIKNKKNLGYCGGNNIGIKKSKGEYVFVLNNDTEVDPQFLQPLVDLMEKDKKVGCIQPKILYASDHNLLNAVGSYLTSTGFLYHYGYRKNADLPQYNKKLEIYSAKGAAMLLRKKALKKIGLFDEDFFIFFEETDLCHRLWLAGYEVIYEPGSIVYHYEAVDTSKQMKRFRSQYLSLKNRICSYLKNLEAHHLIGTLLVLFPVYVFLLFLYLFTFKFDLAAAVILSIGWNILNFGSTMNKRRYIQNEVRIVRDEDFFPIIKKNPPFVYYYYLFTTLKNYENEKPI